MSAYLVHPTRIGTLAQAIAARSTQHGDATACTAPMAVTAIAHTLAAENLRSVAYRYGTDANGAANIFLRMSAARYKLNCRVEATNPENDPSGINSLSHAALIDLAGEYRYQSCECGDWPESQAAALLKMLTDHVTA